MKKALLTVLGVLILVCILTFTAFAENTSGVLDSGECGAEGDNLTWTLYKDGELVISGEGEMKDYTDNYSGIEAPWATYKNAIINVVIEKGVTAVGDYSFYCCTKLESILLPETLNTIGIRAFSICFSLKEIAIPEGVTSIGLDAFYSCDEIKKIVIPSTVISIGSGIFSGNTKLEKLIFTDGFQTITKGSFSECSVLKCVVIPLSTTIIEDNAFANCPEIDTVYFRGTEEQWNNITFGTGNGYLKSAENIVFNAVCHDYEANVVAPTCAEKGYTEYICKICDESYIDADSYTDLVAHQTTSGKCNVCGMFVVEEYKEISVSISLSTDSRVVWSLSNNNAEIVSTGSSKVSWGSYLKVTASATIKGLAAGKTTLTATINGNVVSTAEIEVIKHEHSYNTTVVSPTCTEKGYTIYSCACGFSDRLDYVNAKGHDFTKTVIAPTCTEKGYTIYTCACGFSDRLDYVNAKGHDYKKEVVAPTCIEKGYTIYSCACGFSDRLDYVNAKGHDYKKEVVAPTCTEKGYTIYSCACGFSDKLDYVNAKGHTPGSWVVVTPAKVGVKGLEQQKCTVCNTVLNQRDIAALPEEEKKPEITYIKGDSNGDGKITAADARIALRISAKLEKIESYNIPVAALDVNGDEKLTAADARKILRVSARLETF